MSDSHFNKDLTANDLDDREASVSTSVPEHNPLHIEGNKDKWAQTSSPQDHSEKCTLTGKRFMAITKVPSNSRNQTAKNIQDQAADSDCKASKVTVTRQ